MAEPSGHLCPECGAPRGADHTPSCGCTQRASDALREARTAEAAAAEDFDPLRIRPYVELEGEAAAGADATMPLRAVSAELPAPSAPSTIDLSLFDGAAAGVPSDDGEVAGARRPRRTLLLGAAGGVVAVIAAAGLASGFFSYEAPSRDGALPEQVRASVPDATTPSASGSPTPSTASAPPPAAVPSASASASPSASPSPSRSSASPSPSRSAVPSAPVTTSAATTGAADEADGAREGTPPVLRRGSAGEEVVELELRLTQLGLYTRKASGHYNEGVQEAVTRYQWARGIQVDEYGVYDLTTRERLESETREP
ncbi:MULTISPECIES: peptidoglycan-binding protein [unclassified Streptomyces]|uniref:peptidoglycan-binding domain-containing protein n=1 Tax=unclassified Streptomyces TaxID=2593676 RepID=UPI0036E9BA7D